jgi:hypothetical protein
MVAGQEPPIPPNDPQQESGELIDPKTGKRVPTRDMREEFARISAAEGRDPEAEKKAAIADLEETLKRDT